MLIQMRGECVLALIIIIPGEVLWELLAENGSSFVGPTARNITDRVPAPSEHERR